MIEDQCLKSCDQENPIHFMTIWTIRAYLAKYRLLEHHSRYSSLSVRRTEARRDAATSHALRMLKCATKVMTSPLTKGFLWLNHFHFPFPAHIQIVQDLRRRPISEQARTGLVTTTRLGSILNLETIVLSSKLSPKLSSRQGRLVKQPPSN